MENKNNIANQKDYAMRPKPIWERAVGVTFDVFQNSTTGDHFFSFELVRCYRSRDGETMRYSNSFSEKHVNALAKVMSQAMQFIAQTDANQWVDAYNKKKAA